MQVQIAIIALLLNQVMVEARILKVKNRLPCPKLSLSNLQKKCLNRARQCAKKVNHNSIQRSLLINQAA